MRHPLLLSCALAACVLAGCALTGCTTDTKPDPAVQVPQPSASTVEIVEGDLPAVAHWLSAEHTAGFLALERLQTIAQQIVKGPGKTAKRTPAEHAKFAEKVAALIAQIGFDPSTDQGWQTAGIDPEFGAGFAFDVRVSGPLLFARITDRDALIATLSRVGLHIEIGIEADGVTALRVDHEPMLMGQRDGVTFILAGLFAESQREAFAALLATDRALAERTAFKRAFADGQRDLWLSGYVDSARAVPVGTMNESIRFFTERFVGAGLAVSAQATMLRVLADPAAIDAVGKIVRPAGPIPDFARRISGDDGAIRFDLNRNTGPSHPNPRCP